MSWAIALIVLAAIASAFVGGYKLGFRLGVAAGSSITSLVYEGKTPSDEAIIERAKDFLSEGK